MMRVDKRLEWSGLVKEEDHSKFEICMQIYSSVVNPTNITDTD